MIKGIKNIQAFDDEYYKIGDAFQLRDKNSNKVINAILLYSRNDSLIFSVVECGCNSNNKTIRIKDLETIEIKRLVVEED